MRRFGQACRRHSHSRNFSRKNNFTEFFDDLINVRGSQDVDHSHVRHLQVLSGNVHRRPRDGLARQRAPSQDRAQDLDQVWFVLRLSPERHFAESTQSQKSLPPAAFDEEAGKFLLLL